MQEDLVDEVMDESEIDWAQFAEQVLAKKFPNYQQPASIKENKRSGAICYLMAFTAKSLVILSETQTNQAITINA
ncbi:putative regulatory protein RecX [Haemophilus pittmaniae HK 85]|uniref:Putative regulatory protein RecX n=1 Tax=Haemophilus pittmaniae HK 85 TaxID=1035188 RepID=F9Q8G5_9PAST|nr:putative regulatory protein RecX [Haemophilus pittmaniae HK 85]